VGLFEKTPKILIGAEDGIDVVIGRYVISVIV